MNKKSLLKNHKISEVLFKIFRYFLLISVSYIILFQLIYIITYAFRPSSEFNDPSVVWISRSFTVQHIKDAIDMMEYPIAFIRTLCIQIISGLIEVITCAIAAYGFARFDFFGKKFFFACVLLTILVPQPMLSVSMYLNYSDFDFLGILGLIGKITGQDIRLNLIDTGWIFYLPSIFGAGIRSGLFIYIYRQFFKGLPKELEEAASIDGAGFVATFIKVVLPSSSVVILTVTIFSIVWHWNEYYSSALFFEQNYPLSVQLSRLSSAGGLITVDRGLTMAGCFIFMLPVLIMYGILQNKFVKSIDRVGIVG